MKGTDVQDVAQDTQHALNGMKEKDDQTHQTTLVVDSAAVSNLERGAAANAFSEDMEASPLYTRHPDQSFTDQLLRAERYSNGRSRETDPRMFDLQLAVREDISNGSQLGQPSALGRYATPIKKLRPDLNGQEIRAMQTVEGIQIYRMGEAKLCGRCFNVINAPFYYCPPLKRSFDNDPGDFSNWPIGSDVSDLTEPLLHRIRSGCDICRLMLQVMPNLAYSHVTKSVCFSWGDTKAGFRLLKFGVLAYISRQEDFIYFLPKSRSQYKVQTLAGEVHDTTRIPPASTLGSTYKGSEACYDLMRWWIAECDTNHERCASRRLSLHGKSWLPTRLIYIGGKGVPRVMLKGDIPAKTQYTTLSHRWNDHTVRMLTSNFEALRIKLPKGLSQTYRDAIVVSRKLGIEYIWIDSLCIIQDSSEDWAREAAMMESVYRFSHVTLAETEGDSKGFFEHRSPLAFNLTRYAADSTLEDELEATTYEVVGAHVFDHTSASTNISLSPLNLRGWVFQERLLSSRIIHFTKTQLRWECFHCKASEMFPTSHMQDNPGFKSEYPIYPAAAEQQQAELKDENMTVVSSTPNLGTTSATSVGSRLPPVPRNAFVDSDEFHEYWRRMISLYTGCIFTIKSDNLMAICGLAREMQLGIGSRYSYGLWERYFEEDLCWTKIGSDKDSESSPSHAPTWSWVSSNSRVIWPNGVSDVDLRGRKSWLEMVDLEPSELEITGLNVFDQGFIRLRGTLIRSLQQQEQLEEGTTIEYKLKKKWHFSNRNPSSLRLKFWMDWQRHKPDATAYLLPVLSKFTTIADSTRVVKIGDLFALYLVKSEKGTYVREGLVEFSNVNLKELEEQLFGEAPELEEEDYEEMHDDGTVTIKIV